MKQNELFPKISAQIFNSPNNVEEYFLFNTNTNKGFSIDGFAALLCKKFTGEYSLAQSVLEFEKEQNLASGEFESDIEWLIIELERHNLITFYESAQQASKES